MEDRHKICFVVIGMAPYHVARFRAVAELSDVVVVDAGDDIVAAYEKPVEYPFPVVVANSGDLEDTLSGQQPDILVTPGWGNRLARIATRWAIRHGIPVIVLSDSQHMSGGPYSVASLLKRQLLRCYSSALVAGTRSRRYLNVLGFPDEKIREGVDVVDNDYFRARSTEARKIGDSSRELYELPPRFVLAVNRLVEQKNLPFLIDAFAGFVGESDGGDLALVIAGDGPLRSELEAQVENMGLTGRIHFAGKVDYQSIPDYYAHADAFVLASGNETWGLVVNEAMASGLPVLVANECGCSSDLVEDGVNGFRFDSSDRKELIRLFHQIENDPEKLTKLGAVGLEIIGRWSPKLFAHNLMELLGHAMGNYERPGAIPQAVLWLSLQGKQK